MENQKNKVENSWFFLRENQYAWRTPCVIRSSTESLSIDYGGRTKEGWQTDTQESARVKRPSFALPQRRGERTSSSSKITFDVLVCIRPVKTDWQCRSVCQG